MNFITNKTIKTLITVAIITSSITALSTTPENTYEGTVIEFTEEEPGNLKTAAYLKFPDTNSKWITWIIQPGSFVKEGELLVTSDHTYKNLEVKIANIEKKISSLILKRTKIDMERYRQLSKTQTVSEKEKEYAESSYYNALEQYKLAEQGVVHADIDLVFCDIGAPYDCYVDKVYLKPKSVCDIDYPILKIIRLSPLYVEVKLDRSLAKKICNNEVAVSIYPMGSVKPVGIYNGKQVLTKDGIRLPVRNYVLDAFENKDMLPVIRDVNYVSSFDMENSSTTPESLGILESMFYKDKNTKKEYVWKAVGQKTLRPGKTIDSVFSAEKVYVNKTGEKKTAIDGEKYKIKKTNKLQKYDVLLKGVPENLKNGDKVMYKKIVCLFWPGDKVKVVLDY